MLRHVFPRSFRLLLGSRLWRRRRRRRLRDQHGLLGRAHLRRWNLRRGHRWRGRRRNHGRRDVPRRTFVPRRRNLLRGGRGVCRRDLLLPDLRERTLRRQRLGLLRERPSLPRRRRVCCGLQRRSGALRRGARHLLRRRGHLRRRCVRDAGHRVPRRLRLPRRVALLRAHDRSLSTHAWWRALRGATRLRRHRAHRRVALGRLHGRRRYGVERGHHHSGHRRHHRRRNSRRGGARIHRHGVERPGLGGDSRRDRRDDLGDRAWCRGHRSRRRGNGARQLRPERRRARGCLSARLGRIPNRRWRRHDRARDPNGTERARQHRARRPERRRHAGPGPRLPGLRRNRSGEPAMDIFNIGSVPRRCVRRDLDRRPRHGRFSRGHVRCRCGEPRRHDPVGKRDGNTRV